MDVNEKLLKLPLKHRLWGLEVERVSQNYPVTLDLKSVLGAVLMVLLVIFFGVTASVYG